MKSLLQNAGTLTLATIMVNQHYHSPPIVYKRALPSVVSVQSLAYEIDPFDINERRLVRKSIGTGFVVKSTPDIKIFTNFHVVSEAEEIHINDKEAKIIYADPIKDIAILEMPADTTHQHSLHFCDKDSLEIGQAVLAIGSPFGLESSLSTGIISGLDRPINGGIHLIQTDAAINPGNSGGPLLTMDGCVTCMVTSIISESGSSSGVGFAIPCYSGICLVFGK